MYYRLLLLSFITHIALAATCYGPDGDLAGDGGTPQDTTQHERRVEAERLAKQKQEIIDRHKARGGAKFEVGALDQEYLQKIPEVLQALWRKKTENATVEEYLQDLEKHISALSPDAITLALVALYNNAQKKANVKLIDKYTTKHPHYNSLKPASFKNHTLDPNELPVGYRDKKELTAEIEKLMHQLGDSKSISEFLQGIKQRADQPSPLSVLYVINRLMFHNATQKHPIALVNQLFKKQLRQALQQVPENINSMRVGKGITGFDKVKRTWMGIFTTTGAPTKTTVVGQYLHSLYSAEDLDEATIKKRLEVLVERIKRLHTIHKLEEFCKTGLETTTGKSHNLLKKRIPKTVSKKCKDCGIKSPLLLGKGIQNARKAIQEGKPETPSIEDLVDIVHEMSNISKEKIKKRLV